MTVPITPQWDLLSFTEGLDLLGTNLPPWDGYFVSALEGGGLHGEGVDWLPLPDSGWGVQYQRDATNTKILLSVPVSGGQQINPTFVVPSGDMEWRAKVTPVLPFGTSSQLNFALSTTTADLGVLLDSNGTTVRLSVNPGSWTQVKEFVFSSQIELRVTYNSSKKIANLWLDGNYVTSWTPAAAGGFAWIYLSAGMLPASVSIDEFVVGTKVGYGYPIPRADSGPDRVSPIGRWAGFDARRSRTSTGGKLAYDWFLYQAPAGSEYLYESTVDGTVLTQDEFDAGVDLSLPGATITNGDVLVINGQPFKILSMATMSTTTITVAGGLPAGYVGPYRILKQSLTLGKTSRIFSIYPDVKGVYVAVLQVFDKLSGLYSDYDLAVCNGVDDIVPLGIPLDMGWMWEYLSDFWQLVSNKEWVKEAWMALARIVGSYTHDSWNIDFDKSLATSQNVVSRRWMMHAPRMDELEPDKTVFVNKLAPALSDGKDKATIDTTSPMTDWTVSLTLYTEDGPQAHSSTIPAGTLWKDVPDLLNADLAANPPFDCISVSFRLTDPEHLPFHLDLYRMAFTTSSYAFSVSDDTTWFSATRTSFFEGSSAYRRDPSLPRIYVLDCWDIDRQIQPGDLISLAGRPHTIVGVTRRDDPAGENYFRHVEVELDRDVPDDITTGLYWCIPSYWVSTRTQWYKSGCTPGDILYLKRQPLNEIDSPTELVLVDVAGAGDLKIGTLDPQVYWPSKAFRLSHALRHFYILVDDTVLEIPRLQEAPDMPTWVMMQWKDFIVDGRRDARYIVLDYLNEPLGELVSGGFYRNRGPVAFLNDRLWAEETLIDNRPVVEANFGRMVKSYVEDFASSTTANYLSIVTGLWYAYANGPTPVNIARAAGMIGGYPYAEATGTIIALAETFVPGWTYALVRDLDHTNVIRSYVFRNARPIATNPDTGLPYTIGDKINRFAFFVEEDLYHDYVDDPSWWIALRAAGGITEPEKVHKFGVRMDIEYVDVDLLDEIVRFILDFKKSHTYPLFSVLIKAYAELGIHDVLNKHITLTLVDFFWDYPVPPRLDVIRLGSGTYMDPPTGKPDDGVFFRPTVSGNSEDVLVRYLAQTGSPTGVTALSVPPYTHITVNFDPGVSKAFEVVDVVNADPTANALVTAFLPPGAMPVLDSSQAIISSVRFDAVTPGTVGITLEIRTDAPGTGIVIGVIGNAITATGEGGLVTLAQLVSAINSDPVAGLLIQGSFSVGCDGSWVLPPAGAPTSLWGPSPILTGSDTLDREVGFSIVNHRGLYQLSLDGGPGCGYPGTLPFRSVLTAMDTPFTSLPSEFGANVVVGVVSLPDSVFQIQVNDVAPPLSPVFHTANPADPALSDTSLEAITDWLAFFTPAGVYKYSGQILGYQAGGGFGRGGGLQWVPVYISPEDLTAGGGPPVPGVDCFVLHRGMPDRTVIDWSAMLGDFTNLGDDIGDNVVLAVVPGSPGVYTIDVTPPRLFTSSMAVPGGTSLVVGQDYLYFFDSNGNFKAMAEFLSFPPGGTSATIQLVSGSTLAPVPEDSFVVVRNPAYTFFTQQELVMGLTLPPVGLDTSRRWPNMVVSP